jgi:RimJ/RimL family protein N-acetyltransferase
MTEIANNMPLQLSTKRLLLKAATLAIANCELAFLKRPHDTGARAAFEETLQAQVKTWPPLYNDAATCAYFAQKLKEKPVTSGWWLWYILWMRPNGTPLAIGTAGFHGPPDEEGSAEIGYSVLMEYQRQGIAVETVQALMAWAFRHAQVAKLIITTLDMPEFIPSGKVAQKCGFHYIGTKPSEEGTLLVYELPRHLYQEN